MNTELIEDNINSESKENGFGIKIYELSEEEKRLLSLYFAGESLIKKGQLFPYQYEALLQLRYAKQYLGEKYPKTEFDITEFIPISNYNPVARFTFFANGDSEKKYILDLRIKRDEFFAEDNYYGAVLRNDYDEFLTKVLKEFISVPFSVRSELFQLMGKEITGDTAIAHLLDMKARFYPNVYIFFDEDIFVSDKTKSELEQYFRDCELYGAFMFFYSNGLLDSNISPDELYDYIHSVDAAKIKRRQIVIK